jgi:hypothetical protein
MHCPICNTLMVIDTIRTRETQSFRTGQRYDLTQHVCKADDVWITVEIPKDGPKQESVLSSPETNPHGGDRDERDPHSTPK